MRTLRRGDGIVAGNTCGASPRSWQTRPWREAWRRGATVMIWHGINGGVAAAAAGHDVVMTPNTHCYFDYYQSRDAAAEPPAIGVFLRQGIPISVITLPGHICLSSYTIGTNRRCALFSRAFVHFYLLLQQREITVVHCIACLIQ